MSKGRHLRGLALLGVLGALLLMQDVTELRRRDRQIMSKDATIREIHHRVKNNLQTVAALLRLQARRVPVPEARTALEESMRRVASIALVHDTPGVTRDRRELLRGCLAALADTGLSLPIGRGLISRACGQLRSWADRFDGGLPKLYVAPGVIASS